MNIKTIEKSEKILEIFDRNIFGKEIFYSGMNYVCYSGLPTTHFNFAYVIAGNLKDVENILEKAEKIFQEKNQTFNVVVSDSFFLLENNDLNTDDLDKIFVERNYSIVSKDQRMILENFEGFENVIIPEEFKITETTKDLLKWAEPLETAFESAFELCEKYAKVHENAVKNCDKIFHYTIFKNDEALSSITFTISENIAQIDDMGTKVSMQGKGLGTMLMKFCMNEMYKEFGIDTFFLNSSEAGYKMYKNIGFRDLYKLNVYSKEGVV